MDHSSPVRRIAMRMMYDGTDFVGWQRQPNGRSVQGELESMLGKLAGDQPVAAVGAGRTDSGVHAHGQVAHADISARHDDSGLLRALQRMSPSDLVITDLVTASDDFHARYRAYMRRYRYVITLRPDPFLSRYAWWAQIPLNVDRLLEASSRFLGRHDFTSLSKHNPDTPETICHVAMSEWVVNDDRLEYHVAADRFLYGMVRLLVGIQVDIARGRRSVEEIEEALQARDRAQQSMSVPAHGLSLMEVRYPTAIFAGDQPSSIDEQI